MHEIGISQTCQNTNEKWDLSLSDRAGLMPTRASRCLPHRPWRVTRLWRGLVSRQRVARASFPRFPSAREAPAAHRTPRRALPDDTPDLIKTRARLPSSPGRRPVELPSTFVLQGGPLLNSGVSGSSR